MYVLSRYVQRGYNPKQQAHDNLPNASATYAVGGMATHWTACTPRQNADGERPERSNLLGREEWDKLYTEAEFLLNTHDNVFDVSLRQQAVLRALLPEYPDIKPLPLGVEKVKNESMFLVRWTGADNVLGENNINLLNVPDSRFCIKVRSNFYLCLFSNVTFVISVTTYLFEIEHGYYSLRKKSGTVSACQRLTDWKNEFDKS